MLVDSHCHLDRLDLSRSEGSLDVAIAAAKERGVDAMLCVCISEENKDAVTRIAGQHSSIYASVGVHPSDVGKTPVVDVDRLKAWAQDPSVVAIGETGLDYYYTTEYKESQHQSFRNHLIAAGELQLPVIVHTRDARQDTLDLIEQYGDKNSSGVLHCFTESWDMAKNALDMNYYISMSGIVTFKNAVELKDVARKIPLNRLLVETDSPYLAPVPYRGKPNMPQYVREVAEYVAELRGMSLDALAEATTDNFYRLFSKAARPSST